MINSFGHKCVYILRYYILINTSNEQIPYIQMTYTLTFTAITMFVDSSFDQEW